MVQCLGGEELTDRRTQYRTPVAHARIRRQSRPFQVPVHAAAVRQALFTQQNAPAIPQLPGPNAELMATVNLRQRSHARQQFLTRPNRGFVLGKPAFVQPQFACQRFAVIQQTSAFQRSGIQFGIKTG
ncbi:hypothetical protein D3C72_1220710 [compost metagenome]